MSDEPLLVAEFIRRMRHQVNLRNRHQHECLALSYEGECPTVAFIDRGVTDSYINLSSLGYQREANEILVSVRFDQVCQSGCFCATEAVA